MKTARGLKKIIITTFFLTLYINSFAQKQSVDYDSLWYSHPFFIDLQAGVWVPLSELSNYYNKSLQVGAGFGLIFRNTQVQLMVMPRFLSQKELLPIRVNDSVVQGETSLGGSIGGWINYTIMRRKFFSSEIVFGITHEWISSDVINIENNDTLSIEGLGLSFGFNSWIRTLSKLNFGVRTIYTYAKYDKSPNLGTTIGGHSITLSLVHRFPKRDPKYKKYY